MGIRANVIGNVIGLKRAMIAIVKRECFKSRQEMFINKFVFGPRCGRLAALVCCAFALQAARDQHGGCRA